MIDLSMRLRLLGNRVMEISEEPELQTEDLLPIAHQQQAVAIALWAIAEEIGDGEDQEGPVTPDE